ncbi:3TM-type holin [Limnohabitans sp.]|uniref:3TM-type holin n=1 Tax=Limnohabitans sp. TaxID=1907725 RepID=UPI00286F2903|nr:3TM-type holin [Limnohabitans sp.]
MTPLLIALGQLVPGMLRWAGSDKAAELADTAMAVAKQVVGTDDDTAALQALQTHPELLVQYQQAMNAVLVAQLDADCKQLESVNTTMRAEAASADPYVRRARPTFMYAMALTWTVQTLGLVLAVLLQPSLGAALLQAAADLTTLWGIALTVVGVAVKARSDDKARALGHDVPTALQSIVRVARKD